LAALRVDPKCELRRRKQIFGARFFFLASLNSKLIVYFLELRSGLAVSLWFGFGSFWLNYPGINRAKKKVALLYLV